MADEGIVGVPTVEGQQISWDLNKLKDLLEKHEPIYGTPENPDNYVKVGGNWVQSGSAEEYELLLKMAAGNSVNFSRKKYNGSTVTEIDLKDSDINGKKIFDVGCGAGMAIITNMKKKLDLKIVGIDKDGEILEIISKAFEIPIVSYDPRSFRQRILHRNKYELRRIDATNLSIFPDNYFDGVLARNVLQYIHRDLQPEAVNEWVRVTRSNGHLVIACGGIAGQLNAYLRKEEIESLVNIPSLRSTIIPFYKALVNDIELVYSTKLNI